MKICSIEGCGGVLKAKNYCSKHYKKLLKYGNAAEPSRHIPRKGLLCKVDGCSSPVNAKAMCNKHYTRVRLHGDPFHGEGWRHEGTAEERFWQKVEITPSCWLWKAGGVVGYGRFSIEGKHVLSHRYAYTKIIGEIPEGLDLDHKFAGYGCPRNCINPKHLRPVTREVNIQNYVANRANNTSGYRGVSWSQKHSQWRVQVRLEGRPKHLGLFPLYELHVAGYVAMVSRRENHEGTILDRL